MKTSVFRTELPYSTESVWAVMTDTTQYAWRSDLKCIETDSDTVFREIYPNGNETVFTITEKKLQGQKPHPRKSIWKTNASAVNGLVLWRSLRMEDAV